MGLWTLGPVKREGKVGDKIQSRVWRAAGGVTKERGGVGVPARNQGNWYSCRESQEDGAAV